MLSYKKLLYTFSAVLLVAGACWGFMHNQAAAEGEDKPAAPEPAPAPGPEPRDPHEILDAIPLAALEDGVILQSGDIKVSAAAVEKTEAAFVAGQKKNDPKFVLPPDRQNSLRKSLAMSLLVNALTEKYVAENKLKISDDTFKTQLEGWKKHILEVRGTQDDVGDDYQSFLDRRGLTDEEFQRVLRANLAIQEKLESGISDAAVKEWFETKKDELPLRRVSHILFMYKGVNGAPATVTRTKEEAKAAAEDVLKKLKAGEDFAALAKAGSDCPSKAEGGDLKYFPRHGAMVEPFAEAAYKLEKVGDTTGVVETQFGFHVIRLTDLRTLDSLAPRIRGLLASEPVGKLMQSLVEKGAATAKFNEKLVQKSAPPQPQPAPGLNIFPGQK